MRPARAGYPDHWQDDWQRRLGSVYGPEEVEKSFKGIKGTNPMWAALAAPGRQRLSLATMRRPADHLNKETFAHHTATIRLRMASSR